jgi:poly-gamma-glutamate capsule biosynthesis protein CapA/YwtB (metallophosphatase superfamily)
VKTSYLPSASPTQAGPALFSIDNLKKDIASMRGGADYIVVNIHWGVEKSHIPEERQISLAHAAIRAGADLIIGHHPHVLQGIERYRGKIIAYSLGNFIFGGKAINSYSTAVLKVSLPSRRPSHASPTVIPIDVERWQPFATQGQKADSVLQEIQSYSEIFRDNIFRKKK